MSMTMELKCCPFCGGEAESDSQRGYRNISTGNPENAAAIYCTKCNADMTWCYRDTPEIERDQVMTLLIEQWNTRATASLQSKDAVERVAQRAVRRIIDDLTDRRGLRHAWDEIDDNIRAEIESTWTMIIRTSMPTGLVADEAAIRADERERCAKVAENFDHKTIWSDDEDLSNMAYVAAGETCDAIAAAIRAGGV